MAFASTDVGTEAQDRFGGRVVLSPAPQGAGGAVLERRGQGGVGRGGRPAFALKTVCYKDLDSL